MKSKRWLIGALTISAVACTWIPLEQGGTRVRVVSMNDSMSQCQFRGEIISTVTNRLAGIERNSIKVGDELETMARNEAAGLGANTIQPSTDAIAGEQTFKAYVCR